jgi:3-hydroxyisobutyrate dehydrogenase
MEQHVLRNVLVWNRTADTAEQHAQEFHSWNVSDQPLSKDTIGRCSVVLMCLSNSDVTFDQVKLMAPHLDSDCVLVDCCTGHPTTTRQIAEWLSKERPGVRYVDCPISGGPGGASQGTLACFLGGEPKASEIIMPHIRAFAANIVYLGPVGSGHAVKAVNNACNVSNLLCLHEGLLVLKKMGVDPSSALQVINKSSGRSLMSQARIPEEVVTGDFNYGFKLGLMAKDVAIATDLTDEYYPDAKIYRQTLKLHYDAMAAGTVNFDSDYTEIVKYQEKYAGMQLRPSDDDQSEPEEEQEQTPGLQELLEQVKQLQLENVQLKSKLQAA